MHWPIKPETKQYAIQRLLSFANHPHDIQALEAEKQAAEARALAQSPAAATTPQSNGDAGADDADEPSEPRVRPRRFAVTVRDSLHAMHLLAGLGALNLQQQKADQKVRKRQADTFSFAAVARHVSNRRQIMEENQRRVAEYQQRCAEYDQRCEELTDDGEPEPVEPELLPVPPLAPPSMVAADQDEPATRQDWPISVESRQQCLERLSDILNPAGQLGRVVTPGEVFLALRVLTAFAALDAAQRRLEQQIEEDDVFDLHKAVEEMKEANRRYEERHPDKPKIIYPKC